MYHSMRRRLVLALGFMVVLAVAWAQRSSAAPQSGGAPADLFLADVSTATTSVQLIEVSDPSGQLVGALGIFHFDPMTGMFYAGTTFLTTSQYTVSPSKTMAWIAGPIGLDLFAADGSQLQVTASNLSWTAFGPTQPTLIGVHGPSGFSFNRILSREGYATGLLSGDIYVDLAYSEFASLGQFKQLNH